MPEKKRIGRSWLVRGLVGWHRFVLWWDLLPEEEPKLVSSMTAKTALRDADSRMQNSLVLRQMHDELRQHRPGHLGLRARRQDILPDLLDAVASGQLVAFEEEPVPPPMRYVELIPPPEPESPAPEIKSWIGVTLRDSSGKAIPGHQFRLVKPDASTVEGTLDSRGSVVVTGIDTGQCKVTFEDDQPSAATSRQPGATDAANLVELEMVVLEGGSLPDSARTFKLKLPDGSTKEGTLDTRGQARVPIPKHGDCEVTFPKLTAAEWRRQGDDEPAIEASDQGHEYAVKQGDCLSSIASRKGLSWRLLWDHARNSELRGLRRDPGILFPGDRVFIPEVRPRWEKCATSAKWVFEYGHRTSTEKRQLLLTDETGAPRAGVSFRVEVDGGALVSSGTTDANGVANFEARHDSERGVLTLDDGGEDERFELFFGHLDPAVETYGVQARLDHLGFSCSAVDGEFGSRTTAALRRFQEAAGVEVNGVLDEATRSALESHHGA